MSKLSDRLRKHSKYPTPGGIAFASAQTLETAADALDAMESALRETANIARQYDSEYAGRTEVYCTGCDERLTDGARHEVGCPWTIIDAALLKLEGK